MEESTINQPILYWYAEVGEDECITFHLLFDGKHDVVSGGIADAAMRNAKYLLYPVICLN